MNISDIPSATRGGHIQQTDAARETQVRKACSEFESLFVYQMLKTMRNTVMKSGFLHGKAEDIYTSLFDQQISTHISQSEGIGIQEILYQNLGREERRRVDHISYNVSDYMDLYKEKRSINSGHEEIHLKED
jgi:flagellar protein FlgJ